MDHSWRGWLGSAAFTLVWLFYLRRLLGSAAKGRLSVMGLLGALILGIALALEWTSRPHWLGLYLTPTVWTGYVLLLDGLIFWVRGESLLVSRRRELLPLVPLSIGCWLIFEAYNLHLQNWIYIGLPENWLARGVGYAWSFATIFPAVFLTEEFIRVTRRGEPRTGRKYKPTNHLLMAAGLLGVAFLVVPLLLPTSTAQYLFGMVWLGWIFFLDPLLYKWQQPSLIGDFKQGKYQRLTDLCLAGLICGVLWEFWNSFAIAKWVYIFPITQALRIFEMPILGYLGFPFFALECDVMYRAIKVASGRLRSPPQPR